jgi:hypothetical protein
MSILFRNEKRKLLASYLNGIASGTFVGGWLPLFASWTLGTGRFGEGPIFLMIFAFLMSWGIFSFASRVLDKLEEVT